ncbi:hypothetical protein A2U01_0068715, partial [Trifolium medium]|nr:hypothetical protein [Trifolium medium]
QRGYTLEMDILCQPLGYNKEIQGKWLEHLILFGRQA